MEETLSYSNAGSNDASQNTGLVAAILVRVAGSLLVLSAGFYLLMALDSVRSVKWWLALMVISGLLGLIAIAIGLVLLLSRPSFAIVSLNIGTVLLWGFYWRLVYEVCVFAARHRDFSIFNFRRWDSGDVMELGPCGLIMVMTGLVLWLNVIQRKKNSAERASVENQR
jgi:hypothetical protein